MTRQAQPKNCADAAGLALGEPTVEGRLMVETRISRRAALIGAGPGPAAEVGGCGAEVARRTAEAAAFEAAGSGIDWTCSPMVDVARDQRWGRGVEGGGEDVLLGRLYAGARVRGFQGADLKSNERMLACIKHFAAYGAAEGGLDYNVVDISEARLREVYLQPYKAGLDAGALSFMASFNEINGVPATGN